MTEDDQSRRTRLLALAQAYEPGEYALCDGVYHVYASVPECCQTLRDDIRWALDGEPDGDGYTADQRRVSDYLQSIVGGQIGSGIDPIGFLIASHAAINELRKDAETALGAALRAAPARLPDSPSVSQDEPDYKSLFLSVREALEPFAAMAPRYQYREMHVLGWEKPNGETVFIGPEDFARAATLIASTALSVGGGDPPTKKDPTP